MDRQVRVGPDSHSKELERKGNIYILKIKGKTLEDQSALKNQNLPHASFKQSSKFVFKSRSTDPKLFTQSKVLFIHFF